MSLTVDTPLRCPKCGRHEDPARPRIGPKATGVANTRTRRGVQEDVYSMRCISCKHPWWSSTPRAKVLHKAVVAMERKHPRKRPAKKAARTAAAR